MEFPLVWQSKAIILHSNPNLQCQSHSQLPYWDSTNPEQFGWQNQDLCFHLQQKQDAERKTQHKEGQKIAVKGRVSWFCKLCGWLFMQHYWLISFWVGVYTTKSDREGLMPRDVGVYCQESSGLPERSGQGGPCPSCQHDRSLCQHRTWSGLRQTSDWDPRYTLDANWDTESNES